MWEGPSSGGCYKYITAPHWLACVEGAPLREECFCLDREIRAAFQSFSVLRTQEVRVCSGFAFNHMATFRSVHLRLRRRHTPSHQCTVSKTLIILLKNNKTGTNWCIDWDPKIMQQTTILHTHNNKFVIYRNDPLLNWALWVTLSSMTVKILFI